MTGDRANSRQIDIAAEQALEALGDYTVGLAKEQAGRDDAIAAIIKYGLALSEGRRQYAGNNNALSKWIAVRGLDKVKPFDLRQERAAAQQIAKIAVDSSSAVNPFSGCLHSRPTHIMAWWRAKQPNPALKATPTTAPQPERVSASIAPAAAPPSASAAKIVTPPDRVREVADRAEITTLKKEVWKLKDRLAQLATFLGNEVLPNAENRPFVRTRAWPLWPMEKRPKDGPPLRIINPAANEPDFALRKEEFEQWLVRRREELEHNEVAKYGEYRTRRLVMEAWDRQSNEGKAA